MYTNSYHIAVIYKLAKAFEVKWVFDDIDTYLTADVGDAVSTLRLYLAQYTERHETVVCSLW